jgi:hypothetical protein
MGEGSGFKEILLAFFFGTVAAVFMKKQVKFSKSF